MVIVMKIHKLLGYLLLGIGAYAFLNANNTDLQANSTVTEQQTTYQRNRHTITLVLSQLSDLKVEEGQRINVGDIISDRSTIKSSKHICRFKDIYKRRINGRFD